MTRVSNRCDKITNMCKCKCKCNPITSKNTIPTKKKEKELRKDEIMV